MYSAVCVYVSMYVHECVDYACVGFALNTRLFNTCRSVLCLMLYWGFTATSDEVNRVRAGIYEERGSRLTHHEA